MTDQKALERRAQMIEGLVRTLEAAPDPALRTAAQDLVRALMEMHGDGLNRMLEVTDAAGPAGAALIDRFAADPAVRPLLFLHGIHPEPVDARIQRALEATRPILAAHGGNVRLVAVEDDGTVRLALEGNCHGCPSSQVTLTSAIEEAVYDAAPDVTRLVVEGVAAPPSPARAADGYVPAASLRTPQFETCPTVADATVGERDAR